MAPPAVKARSRASSFLSTPLTPWTVSAPCSEGHFRGAGTWNFTWPDEQERAKLHDLVEDITYWACDGQSEEPYLLKVDADRIREADEAWIPVLTPDGPGTLLWYNSD
ncbi:DUF6210 family protein [Spirillospora sp. NPDC052269]